jgi:hypothetical protein
MDVTKIETGYIGPAADAAWALAFRGQNTEVAMVIGQFKGMRIACLTASCAMLGSPAAIANGVGENAGWQFETQQDRVNKGAVVDLIERKKGGYYDSFKTTNYNTSNTYIDKQFNCSVSASSSGNGGTNSMDATTSSPTVTNTGSTSANTNANSATNGITQNGIPGVVVASAGPYPSNGSLSNNQSNTGALNSGVSGSSTNANTGAISAGGGASDQVLNSTQNNTGSQAATISGSTACNGPLTSK